MSELNIPESWAEGTIAETALNAKNDIVDGPFGSRMKSTEYNPSGVPILRLQNIQRNEFVHKNFMFISEKKSKDLSRHSYVPGDIVITKLGAPLGKACIVPYDFEAGNIVADLVRLRINKKWFNSKFITYQLNSKPLIEQFESHTKGATRPRVNLTHVRDLKIGIPPLKEQERIVQKIETCFSKIEETEQNLNKVEKLLEKYRESLLAKAFRGELIAQNSDDEPARVLLAKIREERAQNQKGKKKEQEFAPISDDEKPFDIPVSWEWVRLSEITSQIQYGLTTSSSGKGTHKFLRITDITQSGVDWNSVPYCTPSDQDIERLRLSSGDIVFARTGGTVGKSFLIKETVKNAVFASYLIKVRPNQEIVVQDFLAIFFTSPIYWNYVTGNQRGAAQPNVNGTTLGNMPVPLPPFHEQTEIVKQYNLVAGKITDSIKKIAQKHSLVMKLNESILKKAFEGHLVEQIESEGTGHELLAKVLAEKVATEQKTKSKDKTKNVTTNVTSDRSPKVKKK
jgi:type I restriction enzyme S subunit